MSQSIKNSASWRKAARGVIEVANGNDSKFRFKQEVYLLLTRKELNYTGAWEWLNSWQPEKDKGRPPKRFSRLRFVKKMASKPNFSITPRVFVAGVVLDNFVRNCFRNKLNAKTKPGQKTPGDNLRSAERTFYLPCHFQLFYSATCALCFFFWKKNSKLDDA